MAKNVYSLQLLRNGSIYETRDAAVAALSGHTTQDGVAVLARYLSGDKVKTVVGFYAVASDITGAPAGGDYMTIIDTEGASGDVEELRQEINAKLGSGVTSADTVTEQLEALSGNTASTSAYTSVEGAKRYAEDLVKTLDVDDTAVAKKFVIAVDETDGKIAVERGEITSSGKTVVLSDNSDGGVNFEVNIDGDTLIADSGTGVISVASAALVQYIGDEETIHISDVDANNKKTVSSLLTISATTTADTNVKEQYNLLDASGNIIGDTIKIYKDSAYKEIYLGTSGDTIDTTTGDITKLGGDKQSLNYAYIKADGTYDMAKVDVSTFLVENEFESGVTSTGGIVHGVVDSTSEKDSQDTPVAFLTVGENGFKVSGIKDEIDRKINALDASVTGGTTAGTATSDHIEVVIDEVDGKLTAVTVSEANIADADALAALSAKTVTEIASSNNSITVASAATTADDGTVKYDVITDASKIKMSGFTADTSGFTEITEGSSVTQAVKAVEGYILSNEEVIAAALNDLDDRINEISGDTTSGLTEEIAARKAVDGQSGQTYAANTSTNYISGATSLNDADIKLDTQLKAEQDEIDAIETAVGLTSGGTYSANTTNTYTSAATSVADAVDKLDAAIKDVDDNMVSGATMNGTAVTKSDKSLSFSASTSNTTRSGDTAVIIDTDASTGALTFNLGTLDCGTY